MAATMKTREGELTVGTFNVRSLAFNGKKGLGHAEIIEVCRQRECDITGLQETRQDGQNGFTAAGYSVYAVELTEVARRPRASTE